MNNRYLKLQDILSNDQYSDEKIKVYALESFAKEIDYHNQTELLTKLILDHAAIAKSVGQQYDKNDFLKMGMDIALYHHEKWNGSGYNKGLKGDTIPLSARIMALADVYDALRSKRVYKEAFSHEKSIEIISLSKGSHFDPALVDVFIQNQAEFESLYESIK